ncbi:uncharacterized protein LOC143220111 [Lasioglossum baleicum]|uniref:uncharacterized protein LOC143220111 n=1 Tax=Lasioglossum baleicum TaxID=434251 RepID=UPI003FCC5AAA
MEELLKEQELVVRGITRILPNYKKMGKENFSKATAEERLRRLRVEWERCQQVHLRLEVKATALDRETRPYFREGHFDRAEEAFEHASDFFCEFLEARKVPTETSVGAPTVSETDESESNSTKLTRIDVPKFDGRYSSWPTFFDLFTSLVVKNRTLDDVQRRERPEGKAASAISHVKVTAANFAPAWKAVQSRYENKRMVVGALVRELLRYAPLTDVGGEGLASLRDRTAETLAHLANLGCPTDRWDDLLVQLIVRNLDPRSREEWELSLGASHEPSTYRELDEFLEARVRALEAIHLSAEERLTAAEEHAVAIETPPDQSHTDAIETSSVRSHMVATAKTAKVQCPKCSKNHLLFRCPVFRAMPTAQKRDLVKNRGCCFNCLRTDHSASSCHSASRCSQCGRPHHTTLHQPSSTLSPPETVGNRAKGELDRDEAALLNCTARSPERTSHAVLFATAIVWVETRDGGTRAVRALLDQGSEATFVSEALVQAVRLPKRPAAITVKGAGDAPVGKVKSRVDITIRGADRATPTFTMLALVLARITSYVPRLETDVSAFPHLRDLTLADPDPSRSLPVDLLIGADHYGALLCSGLRRGEVGTLIAQETAFGWVISGPTRLRSDSPRTIATSLHCCIGDDPRLRFFRKLRRRLLAPPSLPMRRGARSTPRPP